LKLLRFGFGVGVVRKRVGFAIFGCYIMTSSPGQRTRIVSQSLVVFWAGIWSCRSTS